MALISSSPGPEYHPHRHNLFLQHHLTAPSSPTLSYQDGEISPSFDASFASSMSISADPLPDLSPGQHGGAGGRHGHQEIASSSPVQMDISPAPQQSQASISSRLAAAAALPPPPAPSFDRTQSQPAPEYPFLRNLFQPRPAPPVASASTSSLPTTSLAASTESGDFLLPSTAPLSLKARRQGRPSLQHAASTGSMGLKPPFEIRGVQSKSSLREAESFTAEMVAEEEALSEEEGPMAPPRISSKSRSALPVGWSKPPSRSRNTAPGGALFLQPPPVLLPKRRSEPSVPTYTADPESSPFRMDVDGASPGGRLSSPVSLRPAQHPRSVSDSRAGTSNPFLFPPGSPPRVQAPVENPESGASDRLADLFADDLSPIPQSRKRFLEEHHSPTPASPSPATATSATLFPAKGSRRSLEKAMSTTSIPLQGPIRRQRSAHSLGVKKRPSLSNIPVPPLPSVESAGPIVTAFKRHAPAINGKPKSMRRAFSVADASVPGGILLGAGKENRASVASATEMGYFSPSSRRAGVASMDLGSTEKTRLPPPETGSPITGFRSQEAKGKALPCFGVKEDGLMRISAATLNDVQSGMFASRIKRFVIIDCRFDYEYEGGHITDAINLSEMAAVDKALLGPCDLPEPSTSEHGPAGGKTVLIFHCEFSAKRAPTTAKHLRNQDRLKNVGAYPNIHYPEVYVLQGGYAEFFKSFPERCVGGYLEMDDPARLAERGIKLNNFRNQVQKRQFQRANTFTFGEAQHASTLLQAATNSQRPPMRPRTGGLDKSFAFPAAKETVNAMSACHEDEQEADSSFGSGTQGSSPGAGDSPCPASKMGRHSLKLGKEFGMLSMHGGGGSGRRALERAQTAATLMFTR